MMMREVQTQNVSNVTAGGELHLQQESYHRTQTPNVVPVASNERAVIQKETIAGNDGTLRHALELWNSRQGPVGYNQWVSAFFALTRDFRMIDTEKPPPAKIKWQSSDELIACTTRFSLTSMARTSKYLP